MNPLKHIMKSALYLLPWLGLTALTGCSWEEDPATCLPETTSLQVTVSARQEGDLNSRADENAKEGEFMHDLCVLFVQNNTVKLKLQPDLSNDASATAGNLENWTSGEQFLEAGTYTVYAFANIRDYYVKWSKGGTLLGDALPENIVIEDPAGNLDFKKGKFIPMSAKEEITITAATRSVSIGLDRLVSKVRMTVSTTSQDPVTVKNVTFSGYADKVSPIEDPSISSTPLRDKKYEYTEEFQISVSQDKDIPEFYVNETCQGEDPFSISVTTTENQGVTYLATTKLENLPRNSIYPLTLNLNNFGIEITPTAWLKVTGVPYDVSYTPVSENTYRIEMATGSYFSLTPQSVMAEDGTSISNVSWSWTIPSDLPTGYMATSNGNVAEGHFPSGGEKYYDDFSLQLNAQWTYNGVNYNRAYTFIIDVCHDEVWAMSHRTQNNANSRATDSSNWLIPEFLNMYKIR